MQRTIRTRTINFSVVNNEIVKTTTTDVKVIKIPDEPVVTPTPQPAKQPFRLTRNHALIIFVIVMAISKLMDGGI